MLYLTKVADILGFVLVTGETVQILLRFRICSDLCRRCLKLHVYQSDQFLVVVQPLDKLLCD